MLNLIPAQVAYAAAKSDYIQALYDYTSATARQERVMGELVT